MIRSHDEFNYYLTQVLSAYGCFRAYLHKSNYEDAPYYPVCGDMDENAEQAFFHCPHFSLLQDVVERTLNTRLIPENLVTLMMSSKDAWEEINAFAVIVMKEFLRAERARKKAT